MKKDEIESLRLEDSELIPKIGKNSEALTDELAYKLQRYSLPKNDGVLIVVTGNKSQDTLVRVKIWRALSNLISSEGWQSVPHSKGNQQNFQVAIAIVVAGIVVAAVVLIILLQLPLKEPKDIVPSPNPIKASVNRATDNRITNQTQQIFPNTPLIPLKKLSIPLEK